MINIEDKVYCCGLYGLCKTDKIDYKKVDEKLKCLCLCSEQFVERACKI